jgi:hypothetical protein
MPQLQRYVSDELTHFAGRGKSEQDQYKILVTILTKRTLLAYGRDRGPVRPEGGGGGLIMDPHQRLGDLFSAEIVCFCDIPIGDLAFHAAKYSRFGIAFSKKFLLPRGANPVLYVAEAELGIPRSPADVAYGQGASRVGLYKTALVHSQRLLLEPREPNDMAALNDLRSFIGWYIGCFIKDFDPRVDENDLQNFYMEREWRVVGNVEFELDDVARVFLPRSCMKAFRRDVCDYYGPLQEV